MLTAAEVEVATGGRVVSRSREARFASVSTDSRKARVGELFVALTGDRFDGHDFVDAAVAAGVTGVICERGRASERADVVYIEVDDSLRALGDVAAFHRGRFQVPVVAITGSNGKTTTKEMLRAILAEHFAAGDVLATEGNFNNLIGLPLTLFGLERRHRVAVVEMGMNAPGEIARLTEIARPTVGLITCVAEAHLEGLGSIAGVARAKGELFAGLERSAVAVVNLDDSHVVEVAGGFTGRRLTYGEEGNVCARRVRTEEVDRCSFELSHGGDTAPVELPVGGRHNIANALGAAACGLALAVELETIAAGLTRFAPPPMRLSPERLANGVLVLNDAYNANPASLRAALATLEEARATRRFVVVGDMRELGRDTADWHRRAGAAAAAISPALLCAVGEHSSDLCRGAVDGGLETERARVCRTRTEAAAAVAESWRHGDVVLVKGSRASAMEEVVKDLRARAGHK